MTGFLAGLVAIIIEALVSFFTSQAFIKAAMSLAVYIFIFAVIPMLIYTLVPSTVMNSLSTYINMLQSGDSSLACQGTANPTSNISIPCSSVIPMTSFGPGIAYILGWFQFKAALEVFLPVLAVRFLFKRI